MTPPKSATPYDPPRPAPAPPPLARMPAPAPVAAPAAETVRPVLLVLDGGRPTVTVAPGDRASLAGLLRNQSGVVDNYDVRVAGVPAAWTAPPPTAYLLPFGSGDEHEQRFEVVLAPPRAPEAEARSWPLAIEVVSRSRAEVVARAHATLEILPFHEVAMRARPQQRRSRRSARFAVELESRGNAPATVALSRTGGGDGASVSLDPPSVQLPAGGRATARLRVTPRRTIWWGRPEEHRVDVSAAVASGETGASPPPQAVTLRQLPRIPWWVPLALFALIALFALRGEKVVAANQVVSVPDSRGAIEPGDATISFQNPAAGDQARLGGPVNVILVEADEPAEDEEAEQAPAEEQEGAVPGDAGEGTAGQPDAVNEVQP
jgi:hypothetical protein